MAKPRSILVRLDPERHRDVLQRLDELRARRAVNRTVIAALRAYFTNEGVGNDAPSAMLRALQRLYPDMPRAGIEALAASEALASLHPLFQAADREVFELNAPLLVEAARHLLSRAGRFYRENAAEPPEAIRPLLRATSFLLEDESHA